MTTRRAESHQPGEALGSSLVALYPVAFRLAYGMLHDSAQAEDAVQEAALAAWRRRDDLRDPSSLRAWFLAIVANQCRMTMRGRWWSTIRQPWVGGRADPGADMIASRLDLQRELARLPYDQRLACVLRFYLDLPYDEVARVTGSTVVAARARTSRAARSMRRHLDVLEDAR